MTDEGDAVHDGLQEGHRRQAMGQPEPRMHGTVEPEQSLPPKFGIRGTEGLCNLVRRPEAGEHLLFRGIPLVGAPLPLPQTALQPRYDAFDRISDHEEHSAVRRIVAEIDQPRVMAMHVDRRAEAKLPVPADDVPQGGAPGFADVQESKSFRHVNAASEVASCPQPAIRRTRCSPCLLSHEGVANLA